MVKRPVHRIKEGEITPEFDELADEVIVELKSLGQSIVKLLATPLDLLDLAYGHIYSESRGSISSATLQGNDVVMEGNFNPRPVEDILTAACGACSTGELEAPLKTVTQRVSFHGRIFEVMENMLSMQQIFHETGGVHAAAIVDEKGRVSYVREDIGRHNAMDKAIGAAIRNGIIPRIVAISSRIGWELVAKAVRANIPLIIAAGAVSSAAESLARSSNITLIGFASRENPLVIGPTSRIVDKHK